MLLHLVTLINCISTFPSPASQLKFPWKSSPLDMVALGLSWRNRFHSIVSLCLHVCVLFKSLFFLFFVLFFFSYFPFKGGEEQTRIATHNKEKKNERSSLKWIETRRVVTFYIQGNYRNTLATDYWRSVTTKLVIPSSSFLFSFSCGCLPVEQRKRTWLHENVW